MSSPPPAPTPLFREEAPVEALQCPACGGAIRLVGFGAIEQVTCSYCGSELAHTPGSPLSILAAVRRQQRQSMLPLHARCRFDGDTWEILGIVWREVSAEGKVYPWQEFLLYNPYAGYRYLLYFVYDRHWALGRPLDGAPILVAGQRPTARWRGKKYRHFQRSAARVTYVEGEFPWQVHVGDTAIANDYVAPPLGLSIEASQSVDGADLEFTAMEHLEGAAVWAAFGRTDKPPRPIDVGPYQPNPWRRGRALTWVSFAVLFVLWVAIAVTYAASRDAKIVLSLDDVRLDENDPFTQDITFDSADRRANLEFTVAAGPLSNAWGSLEILLVPHDRDDAISLEVEVDEWHGVDGGESWSEGSTSAQAMIGDVPGGTYTLQLVPHAGNATSPTDAGALHWWIKVRRDVVATPYVVFPLCIILGMPLVFGLLALVFETKRWKNSDYASG